MVQAEQQCGIGHEDRIRLGEPGGNKPDAVIPGLGDRGEEMLRRILEKLLASVRDRIEEQFFIDEGGAAMPYIRKKLRSPKGWLWSLTIV